MRCSICPESWVSEPGGTPPRCMRKEPYGYSFGYPGAGRDVLWDISLLLPAGAIVAIMSENGAGKSTLVKLLLEAVDPDDWRRRTSAGFQDFARFESTLQRTVGVGSLEDLDDGGPSPPPSGPSEEPTSSMCSPTVSTQLGRKLSEGVKLSGGQ